ncbi:MAG: hypothetical protein ABSG32_21545 [Terriglobia bacterium]|jgi:hypothetical protein
MGEFERGVTIVLVLWGVLYLLGYTGKGTGTETRANPGSHGESA